MSQQHNSDRRGYSIFASPIGRIALVGGEKGLREVLICRDESDLRRRLDPFCREFSEIDRGLHQEARAQIEEYFSGHRTRFMLDLDLCALSQFQRRALQALTRVPYGEILSYGELARRLEPRSAPRAIGRAMACNPLPLIFPCHRVVGKSGKLTGYSGGEGIATKAWLLEFERLVRTPQKNAENHMR